MSKNWIDCYNEINNSYKKKLVFRLGVKYGFFSEFNNMVCAMIYCLQNKIQFVLSSSNNHLFGNDGWNEFFKPFSVQSSNKFHYYYNSRPELIQNVNKSIRWKLRTNVYRFLNNSLLTQDLWPHFHNKKFVNSRVKVSELNIDHTFLETAKIIIDNIWVFNTGTENEINSKLKTLNLSPEFSSIHIRGGDKRTEHQLYSVSEYIDLLQRVSADTNIYIATDDYSNVEFATSNCPQLTIHSLCRAKATGHVQSEFNKLSAKTRYEAMVALFTDIRMLVAGNNFIGTYSSNVGTFIGMARNGICCYGLDYNSWKFWVEEDFV